MEGVEVRRARRAASGPRRVLVVVGRSDQWRGRAESCYLDEIQVMVEETHGEEAFERFRVEAELTCNGVLLASLTMELGVERRSAHRLRLPSTAIRTT